MMFKHMLNECSSDFWPLDATIESPDAFQIHPISVYLVKNIRNYKISKQLTVIRIINLIK